MSLRWFVMTSHTIQAMPFTEIIAFKGYLDNLGKPLNSTLIIICWYLTWVSNRNCSNMYICWGWGFCSRFALGGVHSICVQVLIFCYWRIKCSGQYRGSDTLKPRSFVLISSKYISSSLNFKNLKKMDVVMYILLLYRWCFSTGDLLQIL